MRSSSLLALLLFLFAERAAAADCNRNGIEDYQEVVSGGSPDCDRNRVPDECDIRPANYGVAVRQQIPIGIHSQAMLPGDFDMDGLPDLAILRPGDPPFAGVSIFHNDGRGGLAQGRSYDLDRTFRSLTAADVDGDGDTDLIATGGPGASMLPNAGDGSFGLAQDLELIPDVFSVAFADIDRDGDLDIAAVTPFRLVVMRNAARGDFAEAQSLIVGSSPAVIVAVDLDGDGDEDLVTGNLFENVSVFQNGGDGVFEAGGSYAAGGGVSSLVTVDLDSDGDPDLAAGTAAGTSVLLSERDGSFRDPSVSPLRGGVFGIRVGDFDGDGDVDIAGASNAGSFAFVWNHGGGVFGPSSVDMTLARTRILEAIDLDADGTSELVVQPFQVQELLVFEKGWKPNSPDCNSDGVPDACQLFENDCNSNGIPDDCDIATGAALDCNSNGRPDQCDEDCNENRIPDDCDLSGGSSQDCNRNEVPDECDVRPGVRFEPPVTLDLARVHRSLLLDDLDGDGDQDIAAFLAGGALRVFLNDGRGAFDQLPDQVASGVRAGPITDLDGDGDLDIVVISIDRRIRAFLSDGGGVFSAGLSIELEEPLEPMGVGDFDGDGKLDVVGSGDGELVVVSFEVDGAFHRRASIPIAEPSPPHLAVSDLDADGDPDLAVAFPSPHLIRTYRNDGGGTFVPWTDVQEGVPAFGLIAADLDADGLPDLLTERPIFLRRNLGEAFAPPVEIPSPGAQRLVVADLDLDGDLDLPVVTTFSLCAPESRLALLMNDSAAVFSPASGPVLDRLSLPNGVRAGDLDGDGVPDLAVLFSPHCPCCIGPTQSSIVISFNRTSPAASRDANRNRIPDECEGPSFHRGDAAPDGRMDITDAVSILNHLFQGGPGPPCREAADAQNDGKVDIADAVYILDALFRGGPSPSPPGPPPNPCGPDPDPPESEGHLGCETYEACGEV